MSWGTSAATEARFWNLGCVNRSLHFFASLKEKVSRRMDGGIYLSVANLM